MSATASRLLDVSDQVAALQALAAVLRLTGDGLHRSDPVEGGAILFLAEDLRRRLVDLREDLKAIHADLASEDAKAA